MLEFSVVELKLVEMVKLGYLLKYQDCLLSAIIRNKIKEKYLSAIYRIVYFSFWRSCPNRSGWKEVQFFYLGQILPQFTEVIKNLGMNLWIHDAVDISQNS